VADWNSERYLKFEDERTQPAIDLANRIRTHDPKKIVDLGCGPGNSTQVLADRFPNAHIVGVDNSANMISAAIKKYPHLEFKMCDIGQDLSALGNDYDIAFSNAVLQWVPNHKQLLPNLLGLLNQGGVLAVQVPLQSSQPIHKIIAEVSARAKWNDNFTNPRTFHLLPPSDYFDILSEASGDFSIWETTYYHVMKSHHDIIEWYRGTGLRPYLDVLPESKRAEFESDVMEAIAPILPPQKNGEIIFRFPRLFFMAYARS
jgi:trans-aconitate 2-methyltransferase